MLFNSLQFLVFFMVVTLSFFRLQQQRARVLLLLAASCYFYMSFVPKYLAILGTTIIIDYFAGMLIAASTGQRRKAWLVLSIIANAGILVYFKYFNFFLDTLSPALQAIAPRSALPYLHIILPIGLSFHTFQAMSYTIEVYRGKQQPERDFTTYALYVMYYPQLVAGPIERPQNILPQLHEFRPYDWENVKEGLLRMVWGFFKKVVIADRLAMGVDYAHQHNGLSAGALWVGAIFYSFQIYCDFSGYSDIALGASRIMNIRLMENFNQPYLSRSITTFWERWHVSLSSWFRDYVYIPLGGNRKGEARRKGNVFVVFLLSGLWHGANFTFVVWGLLHGLLVTFLPKIKPGAQFMGRWVQTATTFLLVTLCWVFFRSASLAEARQYIAGMFRAGGINSFGMNTTEMLFSGLLVCFMLYRENKWPGYRFGGNTVFWLVLFTGVLACYFLGVFNENQFIYFQF
jgi:D-alanyl-lipoteichoic acid acyltransferase DltB (MBOAT superfamily)